MPINNQTRLHSSQDIEANAIGAKTAQGKKMTTSNNEETKKEQTNKAVMSAGLAGGRAALEAADANGKLAVRLIGLLGGLVWAASLYAAWDKISNHKVVGIPNNHFYRLPWTHTQQGPIISDAEERAKIIGVAQRYVRSLYEVDTLDFSPVTKNGVTVSVSARVADAFSYVHPLSTPESAKVQFFLSESAAEAKFFQECNCVKRFLIDAQAIAFPTPTTAIVNFVGVMRLVDLSGARALASQDLSVQQVQVLMAKLGETVDEGGKALNPEGWYVMKSTKAKLSREELDELRKQKEALGLAAWTPLLNEATTEENEGEK